MTKDEIYKTIIDKMIATDEDPLEYNEMAMPSMLIYIGWLYGKKYLSDKEMSIVLELLQEGEMDEFFQLFDCMKDYFDRGYTVLYWQLAEFISSIEVYTLRFEQEFE